MINKKNESLIDWIHNYDVDPTQRIIYLHSQDHWSEDGSTENGIEYKMANRFSKNVNYLNSLNDKPIKVIMSTVGGDWNYGMMIYDTIKQSKAPIDIYAQSYCCSMGSIILQAARRRFISKHCSFMIHLGETATSGNYSAVISGVEYYEKTVDIMYSIYSDRCVDGETFKNMGWDKEDVTRHLKELVKNKVDVWFTAEEAVNYGFADEVF